MFRKLLIANRGEIACRIIKTARKCNIKTVALYSEIDKNALHVRLADESYLINHSPTIINSYLNCEKIIEIALKTNTDVIHPGYGFLSENVKFATLCYQKGITFIGPPPSVIAAMGNKFKAKCLMKKALIPVILGYQDKQQNLKNFIKQAEKIGFPLLIKASVGGGGKGIRLVTAIEEFVSALQSVKREAKSNFGNDTVFLEKYIKPARHIEIQIFMDQNGNGVYLFDRDCSIQRRHQKIIEEAPAPNLSNSTRKKMGETALKAAKSVNYLGAGTVEFLVDEMENFYFMEMNTRLQVEHPVTEMITQLDLVEWQFKIAHGDTLPLFQEHIKARGHAFEARLYAENPSNNFSPSTGKIIFFSPPKESKNVRIDTGFTQGDTISPYYDSLIAKIIVHSKDRTAALQQLKKSLENTFIVGVDTNISFLNRICGNADFKSANSRTILVEEMPLQIKEELPDEILFFATLAELQYQKKQGELLSTQSEDRFSPWFIRDSWNLSNQFAQTLCFWNEEKIIKIKIIPSTNGWSFLLKNKKIFISQFKKTNHFFKFIYNNQCYTAMIINDLNNWQIFYKGSHFTLARYNPRANFLDFTDSKTIENDNQIIAPMPGIVVEIFVKLNQKVKKGDCLLVLETMKIENMIIAPRDGTIKSIFYNSGDLVNEDAELLRFF